MMNLCPSLSEINTQGSSDAAENLSLFPGEQAILFTVWLYLYTYFIFLFLQTSYSSDSTTQLWNKDAARDTARGNFNNHPFLYQPTKISFGMALGGWGVGCCCWWSPGRAGKIEVDEKVKLRVYTKLVLFCESLWRRFFSLVKDPFSGGTEKIWNETAQSKEQRSPPAVWDAGRRWKTAVVRVWKHERIKGEHLKTSDRIVVFITRLIEGTDWLFVSSSVKYDLVWHKWEYPSSVETQG